MQAYLIETGQALPVRRGFSRRLHSFGGTAQGKEVREFAVQSAGEMPHGGVDAHQGRLRQLLLLPPGCLRELLPLQRLQKGFRHRHIPFLGLVMLVEVIVERQEALQVAALGRPGWRQNVRPLRS